MRRLVSLFLATLFGLASAISQTGAQLPKAIEVVDRQAFAAAPSAGTATSIDLRPYFPPVGTQSMNDCAAWALSATKSCQEALD